MITIGEYISPKTAAPINPVELYSHNIPFVDKSPAERIIGLTPTKVKNPVIKIAKSDVNNISREAGTIFLNKFSNLAKIDEDTNTGSAVP